MAAPARLRVLVVDDHPDTTESTAILLALDGHDVVVANDGTSGIAKAEAHRPDLILLDVGIPKMNGYEVAREIQELRLLPKPYLVAVTGFAMQADIVRCAEAGFDLHMTKPVIPIFFQELGELLMVSKGVVMRSREVAEEARTASTDLMLQQLAMANLYLDTAAITGMELSRKQCIEKAMKAHARVAKWLSSGAGDGRRGTVVEALGALWGRLSA